MRKIFLLLSLSLAWAGNARSEETVPPAAPMVSTDAPTPTPGTKAPSIETKPSNLITTLPDKPTDPAGATSTDASATQTGTAPESASPKMTEAQQRAQSTKASFTTPEGRTFTNVPGFKISKIHHVQNDENYRGGKNEALLFEKKYWNYGAITESEQKDHEGHYYVISWVNENAAQPVTAKFEYRQVKSKDTVRTIELAYPAAKGANRSIFVVKGDAYRTYGPVSGWRFSLSNGTKLLAQETSYIW